MADNIEIEVFKRNGKAVGTFLFGSDATVDSLKYQVHRALPKNASFSPVAYDWE